EALSATTAGLERDIAAWAPKSAPPPSAVVLRALYQQRLYRLLARDAKLANGTLPHLAPGLRRVSIDLLTAQRELYRLTPPLRTVRIKVGHAAPAATLVGYYREAERRFSRPVERARGRQLCRIEVRQAAERERRGSAGPDAVPTGDVARVRPR